MRERSFWSMLWLPSLLAVIGATGSGQDVNVNFQVLTSGPVHETFASPVVFDTVDVAYVSVDPPPLIAEVAPLVRPAAYSQWVPGYWSFDSAGNTWIWVTGTWRIPPPGYTWVEGYWIRSPRGWRYVSGYWTTVTTSDIEYLPAPPVTLEAGPIGVAPLADSIWVPGTWVWGGSSYAWRTGYWLPARNDWVWVPANYAWTPAGYVFTDGFWDYEVDRRGLLYAPIAFNSGTAIPGTFSFAPSYVINTAAFTDGFFVSPLTHQYYFGDYYAQTWWDRGIYPAFAFHMTRYGYDPLFAYSSWRFGRSDPRWIEERRSRFLNLRSHEELRPPRTLEEQAKRPAPARTDGQAAAPVVAVAAKDLEQGPVRLERAPEAEREKLVARTKEAQQAREARMKLETEGASPEGKAPDQPRKVKAPKEIFAGGGAEAAKAATPPPERPAAPKPETVRPPERTEEAKKLADPSVDRPADHRGPVGTGPDRSRRPGETGRVPPKPEDGARPNGDRPDPRPERVNRPPQPQPQPKSEPQPKPEERTPPPPQPKPEGRTPPPPQPKPEGRTPPPDDRTPPPQRRPEADRPSDKTPPPPKPVDPPKGGRRPDEAQGQPKPPPKQPPQPQPKPGEKPEPRPESRPSGGEEQ